ncbi:glycosyltransferase PgfS [Facklamia miroungae]|uniref:Glycosyltransferase involved in cell wall bisynthesis n=1 Tax=Facklamia miroungae TaxID=120956 RepID=A0A1G7TL49_9LACT|nr:glycosyltransferase family 2 protein [Facklamia miroungae]NKZ29789.1 glycosyltransferase family 2 protein [Facklamia miroungae]SDG36066.1 Glycosyltransferase involved in cell wall bisynthesis [Facklamia miroungae]
MKITILIPFYNEEEMIEKTHNVLTKELEKMPDILFELLYVNDGSSDKTLDLMRQIARSDDRVKYLSFSRNFGKEAGMLAGFDYASGEAVIIMDGDLQNPPRLIKEMIAKYQEGYDVVNAKRSRDGERKSTSFFAKLFYKIANRLMDVKLTDGVSDFRLIGRPAINAITSLREYNRFSKGLFSWIGFKETVIEYENELREAGQTKWSFKKSLNYALDGILSFSNQPLRMIFGLGMACIVIAGIYILWLLINYFIDPSQSVSGYFTTIFAIVFFGGVQLVSIGVLGEYIGKIFYEVKGRPHYIIQESNIEKGDQE